VSTTPEEVPTEAPPVAGTVDPESIHPSLLSEVVLPDYELADFSPGSSHLHTCAADADSANPCDHDCIHHLYAVAEDLARRAAAMPEVPPEPVNLAAFQAEHPALPVQGPSADA
jgi:hypothetical protein